MTLDSYRATPIYLYCGARKRAYSLHMRRVQDGFIFAPA
jgi:hypothetical protein